MPTPDSLITSSRNLSQVLTSIDTGLDTPIGLGITTPLMTKKTSMGNHTPLGINSSVSLNDLGETRGTLLCVKLDQVRDSVSGTTNIDPKGYLTDLESTNVN